MRDDSDNYGMPNMHLGTNSTNNTLGRKALMTHFTVKDLDVLSSHFALIIPVNMKNN